MTTEFDERPLKGEFLRTAKTVNTMVQQLASFTSEVTRVAHEGSELRGSSAGRRTSRAFPVRGRT